MRKRSIRAKEKKKRNKKVNRDANKGEQRRLSKKVVCEQGSQPGGGNDIQEYVCVSWSKEHIFGLLCVLGSTALYKGNLEVNM